MIYRAYSTFHLLGKQLMLFGQPLEPFLARVDLIRVEPDRCNEIWSSADDMQSVLTCLTCEGRSRLVEQMRRLKVGFCERIEGLFQTTSEPTRRVLLIRGRPAGVDAEHCVILFTVDVTDIPRLILEMAE